MEALKVKSGVVHNIRPDIDYEEDFNDLVLFDKAAEIANLYPRDLETDAIVDSTFEWAMAILGKKQLFEYLGSAPCPNKEVINNLRNAATDDEYKLWVKYYEMPNLSIRFEHLVDLMNKQQKVAEVIGQDVKFYPIVVPYRDILTKHMPSFDHDDAHYDRVTHPHNTIVSSYTGEPKKQVVRGKTSVDTDLLKAIRGKYKDITPGIRYQDTVYGRLGSNSNMYGNYAFMLLGESMLSRPEIRHISEASGVDCMGAGLPEGIAIAKTCLLRVGDVVGLPQYIPNNRGDYYCGINVIEQKSSDTPKKPHLVFKLWTEEGSSQNCILAITA